MEALISAEIRTGKRTAKLGDLGYLGHFTQGERTVVTFIAYLSSDPYVELDRYWTEAFDLWIGLDSVITQTDCIRPDGHQYRGVVFHARANGPLRNIGGFTRAVARRLARDLVTARLDCQADDEQDEIGQFEADLVARHDRHVAEGDEGFRVGGELTFYANGF